MIVIDTSAIIAILFQEAGASAAAETISDASTRFLSSANWVEAAIVVEARKGAAGSQDFDDLIERAGIEIVPVDNEAARAARAAWRRYGKGRHPAALNFGDCFAYGLAKARDLPLLAIGDDFTKTDIAMAGRAAE